MLSNRKMSTSEFERIGTTMFGGDRWGKQMAAETGLSEATVSNIRNGAKISHKSAVKVRESYEAFVAALAPKPEVVAVAEAVQTIVSDNPVKTIEDAVRSKSDIIKEVELRFNVVISVIRRVLAGSVRSVIISGPGGIGKSYTTIKMLREHAAANPGFHYDEIKGTCKGPGLYQALYQARKNGILLLDDCDSVFEDEDGLNLLKAATDSLDTRSISWRKQAGWVAPYGEAELAARIEELEASLRDLDEEEDSKTYKKVSAELDSLCNKVPNTFEFNGQIVFITNKDFHKAIDSGSKISDHLRALMTRALYIDLAMHSAEVLVAYVGNVVRKTNMLVNAGLTQDQSEDVLAYMVENTDRWTTVSLRLVGQLADLCKGGEGWKDIARITSMR